MTASIPRVKTALNLLINVILSMWHLVNKNVFNYVRMWKTLLHDGGKILKHEEESLLVGSDALPMGNL